MPSDLTTSKPNEPKTLFFRHIIRKVFLEDWALKLVALIITFGLWFGVTGLSSPSERTLKVPLYLSLANNTEITNALPPDVEITVKGDKRKFDQITKDLIATLDLTEITAGDRVVTLSPDNVYVPLPQGVKLTDVSPHRIGINVEAVEEKDVEVKIQTKGEPAAGYEIFDSSASPPKIRVRGPASMVKKLDFVETDRVDISGKTTGFSATQIPVSVTNPKVSVLNTVVDVFLRIGEKRVERSFTLTALSGKTASFTLFGPRTLIGRAKPESFKIEMIKGDLGEEVPQLILPADLQNMVEIRRLVVK